MVDARVGAAAGVTRRLKESSERDAPKTGHRRRRRRRELLRADLFLHGVQGGGGAPSLYRRRRGSLPPLFASALGMVSKDSNTSRIPPLSLCWQQPFQTAKFDFPARRGRARAYARRRAGQSARGLERGRPATAAREAGRPPPPRPPQWSPSSSPHRRPVHVQNSVPYARWPPPSPQYYQRYYERPGLVPSRLLQSGQFPLSSSLDFGQFFSLVARWTNEDGDGDASPLLALLVSLARPLLPLSSGRPVLRAASVGRRRLRPPPPPPPPPRVRKCWGKCWASGGGRAGP